MFSLDGSVKYWLYNKPVDMRKSFNGLSGIVTNGMCASLRSGDVYIFMNASRNMMKLSDSRFGEGIRKVFCVLPTTVFYGRILRYKIFVFV